MKAHKWPCEDANCPQTFCVQHREGKCYTVDSVEIADLRTALTESRREVEALKADQHENCYGPEPIRKLDAENAALRQEVEEQAAKLAQLEKIDEAWHQAHWKADMEAVKVYKEAAVAAQSRAEVLTQAAQRVLNIMGGPTMTYSPANEVTEWRGRWDVSCALLVAASTPSAGEEKPCQDCIGPDVETCEDGHCTEHCKCKRDCNDCRGTGLSGPSLGKCQSCKGRGWFQPSETMGRKR